MKLYERIEFNHVWLIKSEIKKMHMNQIVNKYENFKAKYTGFPTKRRTFLELN